MRILNLKVENIQKVQAVEVTPEGDIVVIAGRNDQGKSSVLDAIWYALGGKETHPKKPIREGQTSARVEVDLGELIAIRTWTENGTYIHVRNREGADYKSPQSILDELVGKVTLDPREFSKMKNAERCETLISCANIGEALEELELQRSSAYEQRTEVNRRVGNLKGSLAGITPPEDDVPTEEVSIAELGRQMDEAVTTHEDYKRLTGSVDNIAMQIETTTSSARATKQEIVSLRSQIAEIEHRIEDKQKQGEEYVEHLGELRRSKATLEDERSNKQAELPDLDAIRNSVLTTEEVNRTVREAIRYKEASDLLSNAEAEATELTQQLNRLAEEKIRTLSEADYPIEGLLIDAESNVLYEGLPFDQLSTSKQLQVSMNIVMAVNPTLRVLQIRDGSLLDSESMETVRQMAAEHDFQIWIEVVDETGNAGIQIEDGTVVESAETLEADPSSEEPGE